MDPSVYIPAYLERTYLASHPELTDAARELVHNDISANPHKYAQSEHAQALLSYAGVHRHLLDELHRIEDMGSDEERLKLAGEVLYLQDTMRCFILQKNGDSQ